ncbi:hypothetical protein [Nocardia aurantiaca]|uniref:DUF8017 domain-containing protein n=1 Tax=Nocardia aurantiaca TaxID=2675850 RepID=A0A6I3KZQ0_9NOCA|nr:hypothetical protein [Nocardia aurantiaca]MTE13734.1 hypothetical protein [Nocardia aurantiaca]
MTDDNDHWANLYGPATPGAPGGYSPRAPYQQPAYSEPAQQGWGYPDVEHQGWGHSAGDAQQPTEYPPYAPQQPFGYQPTPAQYVTGQQPMPNYTGQQPIPGYGQPPAPGGGGPTRISLILAAVAAVIVLVGGGIAAYALTRGSSDSATAVPSTTADSAPGHPSATGPSKSGSPEPGGTTVVAPTLGISYDVPTGWTIADPTDITVQTGADGSVIGHGKATEGDDYCAGSAYRTLAFVTRADGSDPAAAATKVAKISAEGGYSDATGGNPGAPIAVTTTSGLTGQRVEASGDWKPSAPGCTTTAYSVYAFAFSGPNNALLVLAILADRGTQGELAAGQAEQIIASIRKS